MNRTSKTTKTLTSLWNNSEKITALDLEQWKRLLLKTVQQPDPQPSELNP